MQLEKIFSKSDQKVPVVTIDGTTGSGKSTLSKLLTKKLGWHCLDSGLLYRQLAYEALSADLPLNDELALIRIINDKLKIADQLNDQLIHLRQPRYAQAASKVALLKGVRSALLPLQRAFKKWPGLIADGRDMGTEVFPDANLKIFLKASVYVRAKRRHQQLEEQGQGVIFNDLLASMKERDQRDSLRSHAPLKLPEGGWCLDTTEKTIDELLVMIFDKISQVLS